MAGPSSKRRSGGAAVPRQTVSSALILGVSTASHHHSLTLLLSYFCPPFLGVPSANHLPTTEPGIRYGLGTVLVYSPRTP